MAHPQLKDPTARFARRSAGRWGCALVGAGGIATQPERVRFPSPPASLSVTAAQHIFVPHPATALERSAPLSYARCSPCRRKESLNPRTLRKANVSISSLRSGIPPWRVAPDLTQGPRLVLNRQVTARGSTGLLPNQWRLKQ